MSLKVSIIISSVFLSLSLTTPDNVLLSTQNNLTDFYNYNYNNNNNNNDDNYNTNNVIDHYCNNNITNFVLFLRS